MAEIDNDFQIELFGGLDISKSKSKINSDIETLKKQIKELEISAKIDANVSKNIEKQLNNLSIKLSDVKVEPKALTKMVGEINNALRGIQIPNINIGNGSNNIANQARQAGQQVGQQFQTGVSQGLDSSAKVLYDFRRSLDNVRRNLTSQLGIENYMSPAEIEDLVRRIQNLGVQIQSINHSVDTGGKKNVLSIDVSGIDKYGQVIKLTEKRDLANGELIKSINDVSTAQQKAGVSTDTFIEKQQKAVNQATTTLNSIKSAYEDKNVSKPIKTQASINQLTEQYNKVKNAIGGLDNASKSNFTKKQNEVKTEIAALRDLVTQLRNADNVSIKLKGIDLQSGIDIAKNDLEKFKTEAKDFPTIAETINKLNASFNKIGDAAGLNKFTDELRVARSELSKIKSETASGNRQEKVRTNVSGLKSKIAELERLNPGIKDFSAQIADVNVSVTTLLNDLSKINTQSDFSVINTKFKAFRDAAKAAGYAVSDVVTNSKTIDNIKSATDGTGKISYANQIQEIEKKFRDLGFTESEVANQTRDLRVKHQDLLDVIDSNNFSSDTEHNQAIIEADKQRAAELNKVSNAYKSIKTDATQFYNLDKQNKLSNDIQNWLSKNTAASKSARASLEAYFKELSEGRVTAERLKYIETELKKIDTQQRGMGKLGLAFKDQWTQAVDSFKTWLSASSAVMLAVSKTKETITELKEIDTILTEISKTNDKLSKSDLKNIGNDAFETASKYGKKATDYLSGVQEASRAGYQNAEEIAELSTAAQGAGDMNADLANSYIIATDKAYDMKGSVQELKKTLDGANEITNHNAVNMTELAEGMKVVGSQAASSQISIDETTAALGTLIAVTQQGGSQMGNAFKGILMNLRQVTGEVDGEEIDQESLTKYEKACEALGVSLSEVKDGAVSLKEPMQILKELSAEYTKLDKDDAKRANLLSAIGGKYRANALNAILENWSTYENMLQQYADGDGSMAEEAGFCLVI